MNPEIFNNLPKEEALKQICCCLVPLGVPVAFLALAWLKRKFRTTRHSVDDLKAGHGDLLDYAQKQGYGIKYDGDNKSFTMGKRVK